jgi:hypothetical protein
MLKKNGFGFLVVALLLNSCADQVNSPDTGASTNLQKVVNQSQPLRAAPTPETAPTPPQAAVALERGLKIEIVTPANQKRWYRSKPELTRAVGSKTFELSQFARTLEKTDLELQITVSRDVYGSDPVKLSLYRSGKKEASAEIQSPKADAGTKAVLSFSTPELSDEDRKSGFAKLNYDLFIDANGKREHVPFSFLIYDESSPSLVLPKRDNECFVYHQPERASGCYQNRTRSTQEVVFNDSVTQHHEVDVQFSGGLGINWSVVTAQLGVNKTIANGTDTSRGSEIHFTNCIECASVIYRQQVDTVKNGDVYQVMADGSISWMGSTVLTASAFAYEFESTGSESQNYNCDIPSKLPVGSTPACAL